MKGIDKYKKTSVNTSDPMELVIMLYDGFLRFAQNAQAAFDADDYAAGGELISRAIAIVYELTVALDHSKAPEFCEGVNSLYAYVNQRLMHANRHGDSAPINEVIHIMTELRHAWAEAAVRLRSDNSKDGANKIA